jgi:hypothetical protein
LFQFEDFGIDLFQRTETLHLRSEKRKEKKRKSRRVERSEQQQNKERERRT